MKKEVLFSRTVLIFPFLYSFLVLSESLHIRHQKTRDKVGNSAEKKNPPVYLTLLFDHFAKDENKGARKALEHDGREIPSSTLFRAFLPTKYSDKEHEDVTSKRVEFQKLNITKIINHSSAHLVLTVKDRASLSEGSHVKMILLQPNLRNFNKYFETKMNLKIIPGEKFCVIDVTKLLKKYSRVYGYSKGKLGLIFEFTLYKNYRRKHGAFEEYFRVDNNGPFILFNFKNPKDEKLFEGESQGSGETTRKRRSAHFSSSQKMIEMNLNKAPEQPPNITDISTFQLNNNMSVLLSNNELNPNNTTFGPSYSDENLRNSSLKDKVVLNLTLVTPLVPPFEMNKNRSSARPREISTNGIDENEEITTLKPERKVTAAPSSKTPVANSQLKTVCRRHEWLVSPEKLNWPNVYHPKLLDLGLCIGGCPFPLLNDHFNFTLHSFFVDQNRLINGIGHIANYPQSHCVGIKYKSLDVMLVDPDDPMNFETKRYYDISVDTCGCR